MYTQCDTGSNTPLSAGCCDGNGELAGLTSRTDTHRCSVVSYVCAIKACLLCTWGNFCLNREHLSLEEVINMFPQGEGRKSASLMGRKAILVSKRPIRSRQLQRAGRSSWTWLYLPPTLGRWLMQWKLTVTWYCGLMQSLALLDLKMVTKHASSWTCQEDTPSAEVHDESILREAMWMLESQKQSKSKSGSGNLYKKNHTTGLSWDTQPDQHQNWNLPVLGNVAQDQGSGFSVRSLLCMFCLTVRLTS